jgi:two-component system, OmpR family, phosphate regulon response regulator PhoB
MMAVDRCVVAGDSSLFAALRQSLGPSGPDLEAARDGESAIRLLSRQEVCGLIVEDQLTDMRATEVLKRVREHPETRTKPVILVSCRDDEIDRVLAFELGADDFVAKPFSPRELALRLRAVLRRAQTQADQPLNRLQIERLCIDVPGHEVTVDGQVVPLTALEFKLLLDLVRHRGLVRSREKLLESVWHHPSTLETRTVDTHVKRLREKLGEVGRQIETVRGVGYRLK